MRTFCPRKDAHGKKTVRFMPPLGTSTGATKRTFLRRRVLLEWVKENRQKDGMVAPDVDNRSCKPELVPPLGKEMLVSAQLKAPRPGGINVTLLSTFLMLNGACTGQLFVREGSAQLEARSELALLINRKKRYCMTIGKALTTRMTVSGARCFSRLHINDHLKV
jgi:hypothetical protein